MKSTPLDDFFTFLMKGNLPLERRFSPSSCVNEEAVSEKLEEIKNKTQAIWNEIKIKTVYCTFLSLTTALLFTHQIKHIATPLNFLQLAPLLFSTLALTMASIFLSYRAFQAHAHLKKCDEYSDVFQFKQKLMQFDLNAENETGLQHLLALENQCTPPFYQRAIDSFRQNEKNQLVKGYFSSMSLDINDIFFNLPIHLVSTYSIEDNSSSFNINDQVTPFLVKYPSLNHIEPFFSPSLYLYFSTALQNVKTIIHNHLDYVPSEANVNLALQDVKNIAYQFLNSSYQEPHFSDFFDQFCNKKRIFSTEEAQFHALGLLCHQLVQSADYRLTASFAVKTHHMKNILTEPDLSLLEIARQSYQDHFIGVLLFLHFKVMFYTEPNSYASLVVKKAEDPSTSRYQSYRLFLNMVRHANPELPIYHEALHQFLLAFSDFKKSFLKKTQGPNHTQLA
ncbi:MAG: hypothetical protein QRY71_02810 [Candidatus Rhabdochlamydia sp.]